MTTTAGRLPLLLLLAAPATSLVLPRGAAVAPSSIKHRPALSTAPLRTAVYDISCSGGGNAEDDERAETLEYLTTLGGFTAGSVGLFVALTAGAGLEDIYAGNIVLVTLCAVGAYLLFFDGGATQKGLENQAVRQLAQEEGEVMAEAPRAAVSAVPAAAAAVEPAAVSSLLERDGFARVDEVLSAATAKAMLEHVNEELERKRAETAGADPADLRTEGSFGDVLMRENRYDLYLDLDGPVRAALDEALKPLRPVLGATLGADAELFELAALISDPRSPRQPVHPDTPFRAGEAAAVVTAFVALQDVDGLMGPTSVIPGTHTAKAHERFNTKDDGGRERVALLREEPNHVGVLGVGDANLIDSRLFHCGGANDSTRRRVLFYFSFRRRGKVTPSGSLLYSLRRAGHALDDADEWASTRASTSASA